METGRLTSDKYGRAAVMQIDTHAENRSYRLLDLYSRVAGDRGGTMRLLYLHKKQKLTRVEAEAGKS